jgi:hypothetical protein
MPKYIIIKTAIYNIMNILILIKSNSDITLIENCKSRSEFFAYTIKNILPDYLNITIKNSSQNLSNITHQPDHIIYINDTGFYYENTNFIKNIRKLFKSTISTFSISNKFYTNEDMMFGITKNGSNNKYIYIPPPLNEDLYIKRDTNYFCILFDNTKKIYDNQICIAVCEIFKKMGINDNIIVCTIDTTLINYYDLDLNFIDTIYFDSYLEYINELSKGNLYFITSLCSDVYKLYECSMCNIPIMTHMAYVPKNIVDELNIYIYSKLETIIWGDVFEKIDTFNIRETLIMKNYSWINTVTTIINNLDSNIKVSSDVILARQNNIGTLNITNFNKPNITNKQTNVEDSSVLNKICEILEINTITQPKPKRRLLLQSQLLTK